MTLPPPPQFFHVREGKISCCSRDLLTLTVLLFFFLFHLQVTATDTQFSELILPLHFRQELSTFIYLQVFDFTTVC